MERILAIYVDGFGDLSHGLPSFGGMESKAVLRERLLALFSRYRVAFVPITIEIMVFGPSALAYGWHELTLHPRTGEPASRLRTRFMELWRKGCDGSWRIALFLDNTDQQSMLVEDMILAVRAGKFDAATEKPS